MAGARLTGELRGHEIRATFGAPRLAKTPGLVDGRHTGSSPALLSKPELNKIVQTLSTLLGNALLSSIDAMHVDAPVPHGHHRPGRTTPPALAAFA